MVIKNQVDIEELYKTFMSLVKHGKDNDVKIIKPKKERKDAYGHRKNR